MSRFLLPVVWIGWGLAYPLMSFTLEAVDLFSSRLIIVPLSGLVLLAVGTLSGAPPVPERRMWGHIALTGFFNMGLFQIFLISGIATLGPSRTPIIIYTMPVWSALLASVMLKERITARVALSLLLSLSAVAIVISQETAVRSAPVGTLLTLLLSASTLEALRFSPAAIIVSRVVAGASFLGLIVVGLVQPLRRPFLQRAITGRSLVPPGAANRQSIEQPDLQTA